MHTHISYHIISYHIISYHIISHHIISYHIISYHIISYHIISYHIISYIYAHVYMYVYVHVPTFLYIYMHMCTCTCMYMCLYVQENTEHTTHILETPVPVLWVSTIGQRPRLLWQWTKNASIIRRGACIFGVFEVSYIGYIYFLLIPPGIVVPFLGSSGLWIRRGNKDHR